METKIISDGYDWVISEISKEIKNNVKFTEILKSDNLLFNKRVHHFDTYNFLKKIFYLNTYSLSYFHGYPTNSHNLSLKKKFFKTIKKKDKFKYIHVSHEKMKNYFLENGISSNKIILIPICIDRKYLLTESIDKIYYRKKFNIPLSAFTIGSFQKDGVGWGEGLEPKFEKGPDLFIQTIKLLRNRIKELFVILSGPSRGYMINNLKKLNVPFLHLNINNYSKIFELYRALDTYLVSSREEGGPRAVLESLSQKTHLVTTPIGQAVDILKNTDFLSNSYRPEELSEMIYKYYLSDSACRTKLSNDGFLIAKKNTYHEHINNWNKILF